MSRSPSYQRGAACASPESRREGDFSPQQFYDNLKSLEEHETCDDEKDPIVNNIPDNYSSSPLEAQICASVDTNDLGKVCSGMLPQELQVKRSGCRKPRRASTIKGKLAVSPEFMQDRALDGRFITLVNTKTQTDWEWVEQSLSLSCQVQKEIKEPQLFQDGVITDNVFSTSEETDDEKSLEEYDLPCFGLPRLIAHKPEPKQTPHVEKFPGIESKMDVHLSQCYHCQQLWLPFIDSGLLEIEQLFGKGKRDKSAQKDNDVNTLAAVTKEGRKGAKARGWEMLRLLQLTSMSRRNKNKNSLTDIKDKTSFRLSKDIPYIKDEHQIPWINITNTTGVFTLQEKTDAEPKRKDVIKKFYKSGQRFLTLCPDGTGNVFYPSGKAAIIISSTEAADFTYIVLEDKDVGPRIKGIFTNRGFSTCYHPNGKIWLNLTPGGGLRFTEAGVLTRHWNWLCFDPHVRELPFKPVTITLGPHISVRIYSQERMYVTFAHQEQTARFCVGSKLKLICPESYDKPQQSGLERYIQMKRREIHSLLGQIQTCMSHHSANLQNIKPHYSIIARMQRLNKQIGKDKSPKKKKSLRKLREKNRSGTC